MLAYRLFGDFVRLMAAGLVCTFRMLGILTDTRTKPKDRPIYCIYCGTPRHPDQRFCHICNGKMWTA